MRKFLLAFVLAGPAALTSQAFAFDVYVSESYRTQCPKTDTSKQHLEGVRSSCRLKCDTTHDKNAKSIFSCKSSCDRAYDTCVAKYKEWDAKKAECRKPIGVCIAACPAGSANEKCTAACVDKYTEELGKCAERAEQ